jgi:hypothetical protein
MSDKNKKAEESHHRSLVTDYFFGLPHQPPFVFIQKLIACDPGASAECETQFKKDDSIWRAFSRRSAGAERDFD